MNLNEEWQSFANYEPENFLSYFRELDNIKFIISGKELMNYFI